MVRYLCSTASRQSCRSHVMMFAVLPKFETKAFTSSSYIVRDSPENIRVAVSARYDTMHD